MTALAFGLLAFEGVEELDLIGPWELIASWPRHLGGASPCLVIAQQKAPTYLRRRQPRD